MKHGRARLKASPGPHAAGPQAVGRHRLGLGNERDGVICVPPGYQPSVPMPLVLLLHGAVADASCLLPSFQAQIDDGASLILAVDSRRSSSWDMIVGDWGPDVAFLDRALSHVFATYAVRPDRIAIGGFSDGASYALSLGLANGHLFRHVLAFSPGFAGSPVLEGAPRIFLSHGTRDFVLPIDRCSRPLRTRLERAGYVLCYREFNGPHTIPAEIAAEAFRWWLDDTPCEAGGPS